MKAFFRKTLLWLQMLKCLLESFVGGLRLLIREISVVYFLYHQNNITCTGKIIRLKVATATTILTYLLLTTLLISGGSGEIIVFIQLSWCKIIFHITWYVKLLLWLD